jgi:PTS system galactitol-specific IIA component
MDEYTCIAIHGSAKDSCGAIQLAGDALYAAGIADEEFAGRCIQRENQYPTGLPTEIPVAIPHCDKSGTDRSGICFLHLSQPVAFGRADLIGGYVETDMIFALALAHDSQHVRILKALFSLFRNPEELQRCRSLNDDEAAVFLQHYLTSDR